MKNYHLTKKGFRSLLGVCMALILALGIGLGSMLVHFTQNADTNVQDETALLETSSDTSLSQIMPIVILFDEDTSRLNQAEVKKLDLFITLANKRSGERICVSGNTASSDSEAASNHLSQLRAKSVADYLVNHGIEQSRIDVEAKGYQNLADTDNVFSFRNRRVELSFR